MRRIRTSRSGRRRGARVGIVAACAAAIVTGAAVDPRPARGDPEVASQQPPAGVLAEPARQPAGVLAEPARQPAGVLEWVDRPGRRAPRIETRIETHITGVVARTRVVQRFRNPEDTWLDAVYAFPLPEGAAVDTLAVQSGSRRIEGRIEERAAARARYERARDDGHRAALLEQQRTNWFRTAVSAIEPRAKVEVAIEYQEMLVPEQDGFLWRLPLAAPAHTTAEADGGAPDAAEPADAAPTPTPIAIEIELEPGFPLAWLRSPTHELRRTSLDGEAVRLSTRARGDRDLELAWRWRPASEPAVKILAEPTDRGDTAVLLMWLPPEDTSAGPWRTPRDWVLALDTSGSMAGAPIRQARAAIAAAIDRLDPADRFDLVAFDEEATRLFGEARPANRDNKEAARHFVQGLDAGGGTNIAAALDAALPGPSGGDPDDRVRQVVFVSDGAAPDEARLLERLDAQLGRARFHAVAIGSAPNGAFLRAAARIGRGSVTFIPARREVGERMARLFEKLESPVTTDLEVHWNDPVEMWPPRLPDLLAGEPLVATALIPRFVGEVAVTGRRRGRPVDWRVPLVAGAERAGIARLFARHKIRALTDSLARGADREAVDRAVLETALRHGIVSRQTSLVAVDVSPLRPPSAPSVRRDGSARLGAASDPFAEGMGVLPAGATSGPLWLRLGITLLGLSTIVGLARPLGRARR